MDYILQGFNITAPSEFYVLCRFAKVYVIFPCEAMFDIICSCKYVADFMNVKPRNKGSWQQSCMFVKHMNLICCITMIPEHVNVNKHILESIPCWVYHLIVHVCTVAKC